MKYQKILIVNPFGIGDVLFTTPLISLLKEEIPDSSVSYWCNERTRPILANNQHIDRIFTISRGDLKKIFAASTIKGIKAFFYLAGQIKAEKFDLAFDLSLDHRYSLLLKLVGIRKRIGFDYKDRGKFLTDKIKIGGYADKHMVEHYLSLLKFLNIEPKITGLGLYPSEEHIDKAKAALNSLGVNDKDLLIGIAAGAGASWGKDAELKRWPAVKFAQLADKMADNLNAKILLLGDEQEEDIADTIIRNMRNKPLDLTGKTSLEELIALISLLHIVVVNDGGMLHMAVALGVKTVSIFGPVDEVVYGPYPPSPDHIIIKNSIKCRPCYQNFRMPPCANNRECLTGLTVEDVYSGVKKLATQNAQ